MVAAFNKGKGTRRTVGKQGAERAVRVASHVREELAFRAKLLLLGLWRSTVEAVACSEHALLYGDAHRAVDDPDRLLHGQLSADGAGEGRVIAETVHSEPRPHGCAEVAPGKRKRHLRLVTAVHLLDVSVVAAHGVGAAVDPRLKPDEEAVGEPLVVVGGEEGVCLRGEGQDALTLAAAGALVRKGEGEVHIVHGDLDRKGQDGKRVEREAT